MGGLWPARGSELAKASTRAARRACTARASAGRRNSGRSSCRLPFGDLPGEQLRHPSGAGPDIEHSAQRRVGKQCEQGLLDRAYRNPEIVERTVGEVMETEVPGIAPATSRGAARGSAGATAGYAVSTILV